MTNMTPEQTERFEMMLPLADYWARKIALRYGQDPAEFTSAAMEGAWKAARTYDESAGVPLRRWARLKIKGSIIDYARAVMQQSGGHRDESKRVTVIRADMSTESEDQIVLEGEHGAYSIERGYADVEVSDELNRILGYLDEREREILVRTIAGDETLKVVGESMGITESRACQIRTAALKRAARIADTLNVA